MTFDQSKVSSRRQRQREYKKGSTWESGLCQSNSRGTHAHVQLNRAICRAADQEGVEGILNTIAMSHGMMSFVNLSTAVHRLASLTENDAQMLAEDSRFENLCVQIQSELQDQVMWGQEVAPRCWATIAWSFAKLHNVTTNYEQALHVIAVLSTPHLSKFKSFELTNLLWAFAKSRVSSPSLYEAAILYIEKNISMFSRTNLSTVVWAYATAQHSCQRFLQHCANQFVEKVDTQASPVELANLMWGLSTAQVSLQGYVYMQIAELALGSLADFKIHELSIFLWSLSRSGIRQDQIFLEAAQLLCTSFDHQQQLHSQGVANIFWAFSKQVEFKTSASSSLVAAFHALVPRCTQLLQLMKPQELSCVITATSTLSYFTQEIEHVDSLFRGLACSGMGLYRHCTFHQLLQLMKDTQVILENFQTCTESQAVVLVRVIETCVERFPEATGHVEEVLESSLRYAALAERLLETLRRYRTTEISLDAQNGSDEDRSVPVFGADAPEPELPTTEVQEVLSSSANTSLLNKFALEDTHSPSANAHLNITEASTNSEYETEDSTGEEAEGGLPKSNPLYIVKNTFVETFDSDDLEIGAMRLKANKFYSEQMRKPVVSDIKEVSTDSESDECKIAYTGTDFTEVVAVASGPPRIPMYTVKNTFVDMEGTDDTEMELIRVKANRFMSEKPRIAAEW